LPLPLCGIGRLVTDNRVRGTAARWGARDVKRGPIGASDPSGADGVAAANSRRLVIDINSSRPYDAARAGSNPMENHIMPRDT